VYNKINQEREKEREQILPKIFNLKKEERNILIYQLFFN